VSGPPASGSQVALEPSVYAMALHIKAKSRKPVNHVTLPDTEMFLAHCQLTRGLAAHTHAWHSAPRGAWARAAWPWPWWGCSTACQGPPPRRCIKGKTRCRRC
jgi:hypothetical protein